MLFLNLMAEPDTLSNRVASTSKKTGVRIAPSLSSTTTLTSVTDPTLTPLKVTGAPIAIPLSDPSKYATRVCGLLKNFPPPKTTRAATARTTAPTTNAPISAGFALRAMPIPPLRPGEKPANFDLGAISQQGPGRAGRDHRLRLGVEKHRVVGDCEDARQL